MRFLFWLFFSSVTYIYVANMLGGSLLQSVAFYCAGASFVLVFFGLLCVALCYTMLYCNMLKCINRAVKCLPYSRACVWFHCLLGRGRICQVRCPVLSASDGRSQTFWIPERGRAVRPTSSLNYNSALLYGKRILREVGGGGGVSAERQQVKLWSGVWDLF